MTTKRSVILRFPDFGARDEWAESRPISDRGYSYEIQPDIAIKLAEEEIEDLKAAGISVFSDVQLQPCV